MRPSLREETLTALLGGLAPHADPKVSGRRPVHTVYGGAHLFQAGAAKKLGGLALAALDRYAPDAKTFGEVFDIAPALASVVRARVAEKLAREPVEDLRVDFEDGYGHRTDEEEDGHAEHVGAELARGLEAETLPPFVGVRVKALSGATAKRSLRTLDRVVTALARGSAGSVPSGFVVTLPKVEDKREVLVLARALEELERANSLRSGSLALEVMVETPRALVGPSGDLVLGRIARAVGERCVAAHFGAYDYTAALHVSAADQSLAHPACDLARGLMQLALAGSHVALSDGATNVLPVAPHKGESLAPEQQEENRRAVHDAWKLHATDVRRSLAQGFYQGWDLHPAQLVSRYAALYRFFREGLPAATSRLRVFVERAAQASLVGTVFDDAASAQGLLNFFLRGVASGALDEAEVFAAGITADELRARSFAQIAARRRAP